MMPICCNMTLSPWLLVCFFQEKEGEVLWCGKACKNGNKICNAKNNTKCFTWLQRKEGGQQAWDPSIRSLLQPHSCPYDGVDCFSKCCVYLFVSSSKILVTIDHFHAVTYVLCSANCITWFNWKYHILFEWPILS